MTISYVSAPRCKLTACVVLGIFLSAPILGYSQPAAQDTRVNYYETEVTTDCGFWGWLSDEIVIATKCPFDREEKPSVVSIDFDGHKTSTIAQNAAIVAYHEGLGLARIGVATASGGIALLGDYEAVGHEVILRAVMSSRVKTPKEIVSLAGQHSQFWILSSADDGYLIEAPLPDLPGAPNSSTVDSEHKALWLRPGQPSIVVDVPYDEIAAPEYIKYLDKFLLNSLAPENSSSTNQNLNAHWNKPYEYSPIRLMSRGGQIEEIPFPAQLLPVPATGNGAANSKLNANFNAFTISRAGIVIGQKTETRSNIFLFKDGHLLTLAGTDASGSVLAGIPEADDFSYMKLSPSGCNLAFDHLARQVGDSRRKRLLTLIHIC